MQQARPRPKIANTIKLAAGTATREVITSRLNCFCSKMNNNNNNEILTPDEILMRGLRLMFTEQRINNVNGDPRVSVRNMQRFKDHCGAKPLVAAKLWEDLIAADLAEDEQPSRLSVDGLLEALHFLCRHRTESEREATFDKSTKTLRKWCWHCLKRIQDLKSKKIVFPDAFGADVWIMTVDGTHCKTNEPMHTECSQDEKCFSHKHKNSGLSYELGIDLFRSNLIWMNGPFPAGQNDNGTFAKEGGLKEKLTATGKKALGDKACNGHPEQCSTCNAFDGPAVKSLKSRAQMRHEQFNGLLKEFYCLNGRFRHGEKKFAMCFEAVCALCQCRLENGEPLFDLLAGIELNEEDVIEGEHEEVESLAEFLDDVEL